MRSLAVLALALALPAQERKVMLGRVLDGEGKALADAEVTLVGAVRSAFQLLMEPDRVQVKCDGRGTFKAELLPLAIYSAWAIGPVREDGKRLCGPVQHGLGAGPPVELRATQALGLATLRVEGLAAWAASGPFRVRVSPSLYLAAGVELALDERGQATLPPVPAGTIAVEVLQGDGQLLLATGAAQGQSPRCVVPPLQRVPVRVLDEHGKGVAGAAVLHRARTGREVASSDPFTIWRMVWRQVTVTGEDGTAVAEIPLRNDPFAASEECLFLARKPGMADSPSGWAMMRYEDGLKCKEGEAVEKELRFRLVPERPATLRLLRDGKPVAGVRVVASWIDKLRENAEGNSWSHLERQASAVSDADGCVSLPGLRPDSYGLALAVAVSPNEVLVLPDVEPRPQPVTVDLSVRRLQLQVFDPGRGPGLAADCLLIPSAGDGNNAERRVQFRVDGAGRASVPVLPGSWLLMAMDRRHAAHVIVDVGAKPEALELTLAPLPVLRGRALDEEGAPIAGARALITGSHHRGGGNKLDQLLDSVAREWNRVLLAATRSDAEGRFEVSFFERPSMTLNVRLQEGRRNSDNLPLQSGQDPVDVTLRPR